MQAQNADPDTMTLRELRLTVAALSASASVAELVNVYRYLTRSPGQEREGQVLPFPPRLRAAPPATGA